MPRKSFYLGCRRVGFYEIGRDPHYFEKGLGFAWNNFVCNVSPKLVELVWKIFLEPGEIVRMKLGTQKVIPLTQEELKEIAAWKRSRSTRTPRTPR